MKKLLSTVIMLLIMTSIVFATQTYVLGEVFTATTCGWCPSARSALNDMHGNDESFPYLIPLIWQIDGTHTSPGNIARRSLYEVAGIPHARFGGNVSVIGGGDNVYNSYANAYGQIVNRTSPMSIDIDLNINDQNELVVNADVLMTANLADSTNSVVFVLTYDLTGIMNPDYFASVKSYHAESFPLRSTGQSRTFTKNHPIDKSWDMQRVSAIVFVQHMDEDDPVVYQAAKESFQGLTTMFAANVRQGPPSLHVQFTDNSLPEGDIETREWDLNGDGQIDSTEKNPYFIYDQPGTYTVSLKISDGEDDAVLVMEDYITVLEPDNVYGSITGILKQQYGPYKIVGDVTIPNNGFLIIEPGVEIEIDDSLIMVRGQLTANALGQEPIMFSSENGWKGLRIYNSDVDNQILNCIFSDATETALRIENSRVEILNNTFQNNSATGPYAGALKIISSNNTILRNNLFANNRSTGGVGAVEIEGSSFNINNNIFVNNTGQIAAVLFIKMGSSADLINNTISHNNYTAETGFHILNSSSYVNIRNSIIRGEGTIVSDLTGAITLAEYSNISDGFSGVNIIDKDPLFKKASEGIGYAYDASNAIWNLQDESPCIDAGNPASTYNDPEDPANPGFALYPAKGTLINDMGAFGGSSAEYWLSIEDDFIVNRPDDSLNISAYPNPFNPNITISLNNITYNKSDPINLSIFNAKGQLIKTLVNNEVTKQTEFFWNGKDSNETYVPSGIYFVSFITVDQRFNHKIMLLK